MIALLMLYAFYGALYWYVCKGEDWLRWQRLHYQARREGYKDHWHKCNVEFEHSLTQLAEHYTTCLHLRNSLRHAKTRNSKTSTEPQHHGRNKSAK